MKRQLFLTIAICVLLAGSLGCRSRSQDPSADSAVTISLDVPPTVSDSGRSKISSTPAEQPTGDADSVLVNPPRVGQGNAVTVKLRGKDLTGVTATLEGESLPLLYERDEAWAVVPIEHDHKPGDFPIIVHGANRDLVAVLSITEVNWQSDEIEIPAELSYLLSPDAEQKEAALRDPVISTFTKERYWSGLFQLPVQAPISGRFGDRRSYNEGPVDSFHSGVDLAGGKGAPVKAAAAGKIAFAGALVVRGNSVLIDHGAGVFTGYHHLNDVTVQVGQTVKPGDMVGHVGTTGRSEAPHLHWEVIVHGVTVDALQWTKQEFGP